MVPNGTFQCVSRAAIFTWLSPLLPVIIRRRGANIPQILSHTYGKGCDFLVERQTGRSTWKVLSSATLQWCPKHCGKGAAVFILLISNLSRPETHIHPFPAVWDSEESRKGAGGGGGGKVWSYCACRGDLEVQWWTAQPGPTWLHPLTFDSNLTLQEVDKQVNR